MSGQPDSLVRSPTQIGRRRIKNRIVFAAATNNLGRDSAISEDQVSFYEARARGGVGAIITEGMSVHRSSVPLPTYPMAYDESIVPELRKIPSAVHRHDCLAVGQLHHAGGRGYVPSGAQVPWSQAEFRDPMSGTVPHVMDSREIQEVIDGFVASAINLRRAGFDGVEVHAAHDFLIAQFLSPARNRRTDGWGGTRQGRVRFLSEVIAGIRDGVDDECCVGIKLTGHDFLDGGVDDGEAQAIVDSLRSQVPVDFIAVSQGNVEQAFDRHLPDMRFPDAPFADLAKSVRHSESAVPVMALGKIPDVAAAERLLRAGGADLVAMCRPLLADADLVAKSWRGERARPCIFCNWCWHQLQQGRKVGCFYAPEVRHEAHEGRGSGVPGGRTVRVVGGGLAGLEFARVAAESGCTVEVYEQRDAVGGRLLRESLIPGREAVGKAAEWMGDEIVRFGGVIHPGRFVDEALISTWPQDDIVVQATGAVPRIEEVQGAGDQRSLEESLVATLSESVVIVDQLDDEPIYAFAESLVQRGYEVSIVTRQESPARKLAFVSRMGALRRMDELGVTIHVLSQPVRVVNTELVVRHVFSGREATLGACGTLVCAGPYRPTPLLEVDGRESLLLGGALAPSRDPGTVAREANAAARAAASWLAAAPGESSVSLTKAIYCQ